MKKTLVLASIVLLFVVGALVFVPYFVDLNNYKELIVQNIKQRTGRDVTIEGRIQFSILPDIALILQKVSLAGQGGSEAPPVAKVEKLVLKLKWRPLLAKKIEVDSFELVEPQVVLTVDTLGKKNWEVSEAVSPDTAVPAGTQAVPDEKNKPSSVVPGEEELSEASVWLSSLQFNEIRISKGAFTYQDIGAKSRITVTDVNLDSSLRQGQKNPFMLTAKTDHFGAEHGVISAEGKYSLAQNIYELNDVKIALDDLVGHLDASLNIQPAIPEIQAALYTEKLMLDPYLGKAASEEAASLNSMSDELVKQGKASQSFTWDTKPMDLSLLRNVDAHVSVRTGGIVYHGMEFGEMDVAVFIKNAKLTTILKEAKLYSGLISGEVTVDVLHADPVVTAAVKVNNLDLDQLPEQLQAMRHMRGKLNFQTDVSSQGNSQILWVQNLQGKAHLDITDGSIRGLDMVGMASNVTSLFQLDDTLERETKFDECSANFIIHQGIVSNDDAVLNTSALRFEGKGTVDLPNWSVSYRVTPKLPEGSSLLSGNVDVRVPIIVKGRLDHPVFTADVISPITNIIQNPEGAKAMVDQFKRDFKDSKKNAPKDIGKGVVRDLQGILNGL